ncbi:hypothetical protein OIU79_026350 [Salix purpurea]|uniref:Disease resistance protein At4g27190-like leucine-rich repeats domain-containing protein n=1 Tax=Salix purpurea TaxID=77065 RepID=A0A9Q0VRT7_SALPP|nr:hypothetical protein OIU79_026350 [Salix purpurea]
MVIQSIGGSLVSKIAELLTEPVKKQYRYMFCFNNFVQEFNEQVRSLVLSLYDLQVAVDYATKNAEKIEIYVNIWLQDAKKALALYGLQDVVNVVTKNAEEIEIDVNKWLEDAKNEMEGLRGEDFNLNTVAKKVARECQGLPIALVIVGRALRDKSIVEWEVASKQLKNSRFQHMELIEDYDIPIEDLTRYTIGYGLHQDVESIEDVRKQVYVAIKTLKDCCMLLGTGTEEKVKMHDLVRDVAIQIASSKEHGFMVKAGTGLKEWPMSNKSFEGCTTISLMGNELAELPEGLVCPQLKVLLLELHHDVNVPERFFEGMKEIEVLSLTGGCLSLQSLEFSRNLQSLLLIDCECNDLIWLRKLQRLKILGFIELSSFKELPDEIGELKDLRLLDVTSCSSLGRIPVNLIGRLKKLEELLIGDDSFKGWDAIECDSIGGTNASLTELNSLSHLAVLSLNIPSVEYIPRDFVFPRLLKYDIVLGEGCSVTEYPTSTTLCLSEISAASLNAKTFEQLFPTVSKICFSNVEGLENIALSCDQMTSHDHGSQKNFLKRLEDVVVHECRDIRTLFPAKLRQALKNLTSVEIKNCESLEVVFELGEVGEGINKENELLSSLISFELKWLPELKCIWKGPTRHVSLQSLVHLELQSLDKLTFIFTPQLAQSLVHLETLRIDDCSELKHLIREKDDEREIIPESLGFSKLKNLFIRGCDELEYVFPISVSPSLLNLEEMEIAFGAHSKQIFYSGEGDAHTSDDIISFPQLRKLSLSRCKFFGPKSFTAQLPSLQVLAVRGHEELGDLLTQLQGLTNLTEQHLMKVQSFVPNRRTGHEWRQALNNPNRRTGQEWWQALNNPNRRTSHEWWQALNNLTSVVIEDCESLEVVFELDDVDEESSEVKELRLLSSLTSLVLRRLSELKCIWKGPTRHVSLRSLIHLELQSLDKLTFIFTPQLAQSLVHLETLRIDDCSELKHLIREKDDEREIILESLGFSKLKNLFIRGCDELEYVFPVSVSPSLLNLEEMEIAFGAHSKQIFYGGEGDAHTSDDIISFPQLRKLSLSRCKLFGPKSFIAQVPSLQVLVIRGHEELGDLLTQLQWLTNLTEQHLMKAGSFVPNRRTGHELWQALKYTYRRTGHEWWQALNNLTSVVIEDCESLEVVFELDEDDEESSEVKELRLLSSVASLVLRRLPELKCIWKGPTRHVSLRSLIHLELQSLDKLTFIFTTQVAQSLVHLETVRIDDCSGLKHLIREMDDGREIILRSLGFLKLKTLSISGCDELEYVFPIEMSSSLLNLEEIEIVNCKTLEEEFELGE